MKLVKLARKLFGRMDFVTKATIAIIGFYLFLYVFVDFVEVVSIAILRYIFL